MSGASTIMTVCIPVYNAEKYIGETLDAIIRQKTTFPFDILISDDCSTDRTNEICTTYAAKYNNVIVVRQPQNLGMAPNQHFVVTYPTSKYIAYCDSDDFFLTDDYLQRHFDFLEAHPEVIVSITNVEHFKGDTIIKQTLSGERRPPEIFDLHYYLTKNVHITNSAMVLRSKDCRDIPDWFAHYFQYDWLLHIFHGLKGKFGFIDFVGCRYRIHDSNASNVKFAEKKFKDGIAITYKLQTFLPEEYRSYFKAPSYETNSLALFYLKYNKFFKFLYWYFKYLQFTPFSKINFRDQFYLLRKNAFSK
jgi:glycosyltransferase involved in cell wall biosynthesis